jgi:hypothetical protein
VAYTTWCSLCELAVHMRSHLYGDAWRVRVNFAGAQECFAV